MDLYYNKDTSVSNADLQYQVVKNLGEINYTEDEIISSGKDWIEFNEEFNEKAKEAEEKHIGPGITVRIDEPSKPAEQEIEIAGLFGVGEYLPRPIQDVFVGLINTLPESIKENPSLIVYVIILIAFISAILLLFYIPQKGHQEVIKTLSEKEKQISAEEVKDLQKRKKEIKRKLTGVSRREVAGLSSQELSRKKAYSEELQEIEEQLLTKDNYLINLNKRVEKAIDEASHGVSSAVILQELKEEGYTKKELEIIKKAFQLRKRDKMRGAS